MLYVAVVVQQQHGSLLLQWPKILATPPTPLCSPRTFSTQTLQINWWNSYPFILILLFRILCGDGMPVPGTAKLLEKTKTQSDSLLSFLKWGW